MGPLILIIVNAGISWWNARNAGRMWLEAQSLGGWVWLLAWCAAIQAAAGFTSITAFLLVSLASSIGLLPEQSEAAASGLVYLLTVIPIIGTGLLITLSSWRIAFREKSLASMGVAAYNSLAMAYNVASAVKDIPGVWDGLQKFYKKNRNNKGNGNAIIAVVVIAVAALAIGCLLTRWIICTNMGKEALPAREAA
ncbi:hypothetical protein AB7849_18680 [Rhodanobacter sp. 115]|nr:hypothetical protein UU5_05236 [Rhodanobacter sp. 115]